jgi:demethylmenaquinone methyltransferase/2-methoxy-6-polyprenyl-1,4-benzoquinol methylase
LSFHYDLDFIRARYNRLAGFYPLFEAVFVLPLGIRAKAIQRLELQSGDRVLEVGCGTGRNLPHLQKAVGPAGHVYGIDCCEGMLAKAKQLCERQQWSNVSLVQQDAAQMAVPEPVDGVLFSLCYTVMPEPRKVLKQAWKYLRLNKHVVIMDGKLARGVLGRLSRPLVILASKATVLGDIDEQPWEDLKELTSRIEVEEVNWGTYYICRGTKG